MLPRKVEVQVQDKTQGEERCKQRVRISSSLNPRQLLLPPVDPVQDMESRATGSTLAFPGDAAGGAKEAKEAEEHGQGHGHTKSRATGSTLAFPGNAAGGAKEVKEAKEVEEQGYGHGHTKSRATGSTLAFPGDAAGGAKEAKEAKQAEEHGHGHGHTKSRATGSTLAFPGDAAGGAKEAKEAEEHGYGHGHTKSRATGSTLAFPGDAAGGIAEPQVSSATALSQQGQVNACIKDVARGAPKLTKDGAYCIPALCDLERMDDTELAQLRGFTVGQYNKGMVTWSEAVDVRGINLDKAIQFGNKELRVDVGARHSLNSPARVALEGIFVPDGRDCARYETKLRHVTQRAGATFLGFAPTHGVWSFQVDRFN